MSLGHVKKHWLKYYLVVGAGWTAYQAYTHPSLRTPAYIAKGIALWPLDIYHMVTGQTILGVGAAVP